MTAAHIEAVVALGWLVLAAIALWRFHAPLRQMLARTAEEGGELEIMGLKISSAVRKEQELKALNDLRDKVSAIEARLEGDGSIKAPQNSSSQPSPPGTIDRPFPILWVDDNPENNFLEIEALHQRSFEVTTARSTSEARRLLVGGGFRLVISDMERDQDRNAGMAILDLVASLDPQLRPKPPVIIYCGAATAMLRRAEAIAKGAALITGSATELHAKIMELARKP